MTKHKKHPSKKEPENTVFIAYALAFVAVVVLIFAVVDPSIVGRVVFEVPDWAVRAEDKVSLDSEDVVLTAGTNYQATNGITVQNQDIVYKVAYLLKNNQWASFELNGNVISGTNWILGDATQSFTVNRDEFVEGANYVLAYGCDRSGTEWDCNDNKWMIKGFVVGTSVCVPGTYQCDGNDLMVCDDGEYEPEEECGILETCDAGRGECVLDLPSEPGAPGEEGEEELWRCDDSDVTDQYPDGVNYYQQGTVDGYLPLEERDTSKTDYCIGITLGGPEDWLLEYYCYQDLTLGDYITTASYECPHSCSNGACIEEKEPTECTDEDNDGYVAKGTDFSQCSATGLDCDDMDPDVNPGATEICDDAIDNDCDGDIDTGDNDCEEEQEGCTETDNGFDAYVKGTTTGVLNTDSSGTVQSYTDYCTYGVNICEYHCRSNLVKLDCGACGNNEICEDGVCK